MAKQAFYETKQTTKTLLLGIEAPYHRGNMASYNEEFLNLAKTLGIPRDYVLFIKIRDIDPGYFVTKGKLEEVKNYCAEHSIEQIIVSEMLSAQQNRNLTDYWDCPVIDRTLLILKIFEQSAHSAEGKAQVAVAMLEYEKARMRGKGISMSQQEGTHGLRGGPGETAKEKERRAIELETLNIKRNLERIQKTRETQRKQRLGSGIPLFCLIGYTNAGKSTLLNALAKGNVLAEDKLFATLDITTRELFIDGKKKALLSDTVGFIQFLPHQLIEAFKSTLSELQYADLLLHVVDLSDANWENHIKVVHEILNDLGVSKSMLYIFNKADKVTLTEDVQHNIERYNPHVVISATEKKSLEQLIGALRTWQPEH